MRRAVSPPQKTAALIMIGVNQPPIAFDTLHSGLNVFFIYLLKSVPVKLLGATTNDE